MATIISNIKNMCEYNNGKGCVALYFTKKEMRELKKYGITDNHTIQDAYNIISNKINP